MTIFQPQSGFGCSDWHTAYSKVNGIVSPDYLQEDFFYLEVEPHLNDSQYALVYSDKATLPLILPKSDHVSNAFIRINGSYYRGCGAAATWREVREWMGTQAEVVVKPAVESGGGRDVFIGPVPEAIIALESLGVDLVVQEVFKQHPVFATIGETSLNTVRFMSLRLDGQISTISAYLRASMSGARIDNITRGGVLLAIREGRFSGTILDMNLNQFQDQQQLRKRISGMRVPQWDEIEALAHRSHQRLVHVGIASWDIALGIDERPCIVEVNLKNQELSDHQFCNGPVFKPFLEPILSLIVNRKGVRTKSR